jgi:hypothetical protein
VCEHDVATTLTWRVVTRTHCCNNPQEEDARNAAMYMMRHMRDSAYSTVDVNALSSYIANVHQTVEASLSNHLHLTRRSIYVCQKTLVNFVQVSSTLSNSMVHHLPLMDDFSHFSAMFTSIGSTVRLLTNMHAMHMSQDPCLRRSPGLFDSGKATSGQMMNDHVFVN